MSMTLAVLVVGAGLGMPEPGMTPASAVPFKTIEELALRKAEAEWPGSRLGPVVPYVDENGSMVAYMFHFRTDGREFPDHDQVASDVLAARSRLGPDTDLSRWESEYAYVLVSARYDRVPIVCFGYGSSEYFAIGQKAQARAEDLLGGAVTLSRVYFVSPETFLEFTGPAGRNAVFSSHFERIWNSRAEFAAEQSVLRDLMEAEFPVDREAIARAHRAEWDRVLVQDFTDFGEQYVPQHTRAPFYDWSYGCTPSAAAMVLGYIDRSQDYGRLVDWFWFRYDMVEGEMDWQVPNVQRECALAMHTDSTSGGTMIGWISPGLIQVGSDNGYSFMTVTDQGGVHNDWAWGTITGEINSGYALVWSASWAVHSLACYGYRTTDKYLYVHNTWWRPAAWWAHSGNDWSFVDSPHPSGGDPHKLEVTFPRGDTGYNSIGGGEVLQVGDTAYVTWDNFGNPGTRVDIEKSSNGGLNWQALASNLPDNGTYAWYLDASVASCDSMRLRFKQYSGPTYTSGDASFGCFRIRREPLPPKPLAPPNGQQLFDPPVVLVVDTLPAGVDSVEFKLIFSGDTIWTQAGTALCCSLPDTLFTYGRSYKWVVRARNRFGWGEYGAPWSFWIRFTPGVAEGQGQGIGPTVLVPSVCRLGDGIVIEAPGLGPAARVEFFDAAGKKLGTGVRTAYGFCWDGTGESGRQAGPGLCFARVVSDVGSRTRKFALVH